MMPCGYQVCMCLSKSEQGLPKRYSQLARHASADVTKGRASRGMQQPENSCLHYNISLTFCSWAETAQTRKDPADMCTVYSTLLDPASSWIVISGLQRC